MHEGELRRTRGSHRYMGKGVTKAVANINDSIGPALLVSASLRCSSLSALPACGASG